MPQLFTPNYPSNHFPTFSQPSSPAFSLKTVGKLASKELHFGNPFPPIFCYSVYISMSLCLGVSVLISSRIFSGCTLKLLTKITLHSLGVLGDLAVQFFSLCIFGGSLPHARHAICEICTRRTQPSQPPNLRHFSGISRAYRRAKMSIQRIYGSVPPVISAGNMRNVQ